MALPSMRQWRSPSTMRTTEVVSFINGILGSFVRAECAQPEVRNVEVQPETEAQECKTRSGIRYQQLHHLCRRVPTPTARAAMTPGVCWMCRPGGLGLRQSDALFQHVQAVCPSGWMPCWKRGSCPRCEGSGGCGGFHRPRAVEGSYMPCFLAGETSQAPGAGGRAGGAVLSAAPTSRGMWLPPAGVAGHARSCLDAPFLAWHLSGGTTELLHAPSRWTECLRMHHFGRARQDISAGQLIDRTGKLLGIPFPAGKALDALAAESDSTDSFPVKLRELSFSLSGVENQVKQRLAARCACGRCCAFCTEHRSQTSSAG